ncbi:hypothetical protein GEV33_002070 [Tenebrio molitor]|uniref:Uncharacterized protein n=1 Tax=Tenebrio molitor TaxID=7067 RepID=A0A8J6HVQ4_TENMO|nr:hypothetical protein GEV33_002070 [Tenebrio molitor]
MSESATLCRPSLGELKVRTRSRTGSRTPTSGAIWRGFTTVHVAVCLCFEGGHLGVFGATGVGVPVEEVYIGWRIQDFPTRVHRTLPSCGFGQRHPCWAIFTPGNPPEGPDREPSARPPFVQVELLPTRSYSVPVQSAILASVDTDTVAD